jgi:hypothetical protein
MAMGRVSGCGPASDSGGALRLLALRFPLRIGLRPMEVNTPLRFPQGLHELAVTVSDGGLFNCRCPALPSPFTNCPDFASASARACFSPGLLLVPLQARLMAVCTLWPPVTRGSG